jgi:hypothetical protein
MTLNQHWLWGWSKSSWAPCFRTIDPILGYLPLCLLLLMM